MTQISIEKACALLRSGSLVAIPTDTVYGIACARADAILEKLYLLKKRSKDKPVCILMASLEDIKEELLCSPESIAALARQFWPGALTLVLPIMYNNSVVYQGFRIPNDSIAMQILHEMGPLYVTSANLSDAQPARCLEEVEKYFGRDFPVVGGDMSDAEASTVIALHNDKWIVIREGGITAKSIKDVIGYLPTKATKEDIIYLTSKSL